ncbi:MAG: UDP-N-acetylglucosamine 2-epimerase, partial [Clostridia bacterium]|nr:UDP-N-acetylglucosamine 2-epimerase [Clostridia bacterium]
HVFDDKALHSVDFNRRIVVVTAHRRENHGERLGNILEAVRTLSDMHPDVQFVFPVHPNPNVHEKVHTVLGSSPGILLTAPLTVFDMHTLIARACIVLTDSGGLQEDSPALGAPVLVLRTETERPEAIESGTAVLAGVETDSIVRIANTLLTDESTRSEMVRAGSPFGDGHASERIIQSIKEHFIKE